MRSFNVNFLIVSVVFSINQCLCNEIVTTVETDIFENTTELNSKGFNKCCRLDQGLARLRSNDSPVRYACADAVNENEIENKIFKTILKYPLAPLKFLNTKVKLGFPIQCGIGEYLEKNVSITQVISSDACIDKVFLEVKPDSAESVVGDGSLIELSCKTLVESSEPSNFLRFRPLAKCCVGDMVYDIDNNNCVKIKSTNLSGSFPTLINNLLSDDFDVLDLKHGLPPCNTPNYMFRYTSKNYKFHFSGYDLELIGNTKNILLKEGSYCIDQTTNAGLVARTCKDNCNDGICVNKCCPEGQEIIIPPNKCGLKSQYGIYPKFHNVANLKNPIPANHPDIMGIRYNYNCEKYMLNPNDPEDDSYLNIENGGIVLPNSSVAFGQDYCIESRIINKTSPKSLSHFICFPPQTKKEVSTIKYKIYSVGFMISCVFLLATFVVYLLLPPLQNFHGRIIMCYVAAMLVAFSCLARAQWRVEANSIHCKFLGYAIYFSFLVAFSWLNVMCFDIWLTFGLTRPIQSTRKSSKDLKKFLLFSVYCFGEPLILTVVIFIIDVNDYAAGFLDPDIGKAQCWFNTGVNRKPFLLYFILPAGIQIAANLILFILTAIHCSKVKSEIRRMQAGSTGDKCQKRFSADKATFVMNTKLFIVMGVSWVMEIISACFNDVDEIFYVTDTVNLLIGVIIFFILVAKKKIYRLLRNRLGFEPDSNTKDTDTAATSSTGISRSSGVELETNPKK